MNRTMAGLTLLGLLLPVGCGDESMPEQDNGIGGSSTSSLDTVRIHIDGLRKSKSGAT